MDLISHKQFLVGLIRLRDDKEDMEAIRHHIGHLYEEFGLAGHMRWVALLGESEPSASEISSFIASHFYDYHTMPVDLDRLAFTVGHAYGMAKMAEAQPASVFSESAQLGMVGRSAVMQTLFDTIRKFGQINLSVMIRGESGTGKELAAQAIHALSSRAKGPFVAVNCGALPKDLIQTELFGHEKGSFTGASSRRVGRIEAAQGGTLFLDEIGDLPLELQANFLRFLQERTIDRVGGQTSLPVDVRVVAATHVNLERAVEEGRFREDLYYRLNVLHVDMPPLRQRTDDIELLANHFLRQCAQTIRPNIKGFSQQATDAMNLHSWPGNVRELVNRTQRAVVMCEGNMVRPRDLGLDRDVPNGASVTLAVAREAAEKEVIETTLRAVRNNVSKAARRLDISRVTLYRLMEQHAIDWQSKPH